MSEVFAECCAAALVHFLIDTWPLEGAVRYSDYSNFGSANTWRAGPRVGPHGLAAIPRPLNVANRAPAINELFAPITEGSRQAMIPAGHPQSDPGAARLLRVPGRPAAEINSFVQTRVGIQRLSGGNPGLREETSETRTIARCCACHSSTASTWQSTTTNRSRRRGGHMNAQTTLDVCYQILDAGSDPVLHHPRPGTGQVFQVRAVTQHRFRCPSRRRHSPSLHLRAARGLSIGDGKADLALMLHSGWLFERESQIIGAAPIDCAGFFGSCTAQGAGGSPDFKALFMATYDSGPFMLRSQVRLIDGLKPLPTIAASTPVVAGSVTYVDFSGSYSFSDRLQIYAGSTMPSTRQPPLLNSSWGGDANTDVTLYDVIGRRYFSACARGFSQMRTGVAARRRRFAYDSPR